LELSKIPVPIRNSGHDVYDWSYLYRSPGMLTVLELAGKWMEQKRRDSNSGENAPKKEEIHQDNQENKINNKREKK
jgi:hypothetical protein